MNTNSQKAFSIVQNILVANSNDVSTHKNLLLSKALFRNLDEMSIDDVDNLIEFEISEILKSRKDDDIPF